MPDVAALVLAAGQSTRFRAAPGGDAVATKLVASHAGKALVRHVVETALSSGLAPIVVVTGYARDAVIDELQGLQFDEIYNPEFATGMASSLRAGVSRLPKTSEAVLVLLGDMPLVDLDLIGQVVNAFDMQRDVSAVVPTLEGMPGNPVLLARRLFPDVLALAGDAGARQLLRGRVDVVTLPVHGMAARADIDTPAALNALGSSFSSGRDGGA